MADELQQLIERIQQEGLAKAEGEARRIVDEARAQAETLRRDAETQARDIVEAAEREAKTFAERGGKALDQAARDVILSVHQAVNDTFQALVRQTVGEALTLDTLKQMMVKVVEGYCAGQGQCSEIDLIVSPRDQQPLVDFFLKSYREAIDKGIEIHADAGVVKGFRVSLEGEHLHHDFTQQEIAAAMGRLLRPRLAEILKRSAQSM
jgi:V/A-type H+-transporting ATPase subunit E